MCASYRAAIRGILSSERTDASDATLGLVLTFIAGAINAGGFLAVGQYTSHMSGILSAVADNLALGTVEVVLSGCGALLAFMAGAACSAFMINWGRRGQRRSLYATPLGLEALLLLGFGLLGSLFHRHEAFTLAIVPLLCFVMGLQNATITKISGARIRTTHVTGIVTDLGIELGRLVYWNTRTDEMRGSPVVADRAKLRLLASLLGSFFVGGVIGALVFQILGLMAAALIGLPLLALAGHSLIHDV